MKYKLANGFDGVLATSELEGTNYIPNDPENIDWGAYQRWIRNGGTPEPADGLSFVPTHS